MNLTESDFYQGRSKLPDVSMETKVDQPLKLHKVGMRKMQLPVRYGGYLMPATVDAFVSLDDIEAKGIHMSRLYLESKSFLESRPIALPVLSELLDRFLKSHKGLSQSAYISVQFELPIERGALISSEKGWRTYPVELKASVQNGSIIWEVLVEVLYSSTCPCSSALAQQLRVDAFQNESLGKLHWTRSEVSDWLKSQAANAGTAHAQRSSAKVQIKLKDNQNVTIEDFINQIENALGTPVQAAVKREDEQEFARLNASNMMFCEDACRRLKSLLNNDQAISDYRIVVTHFESLHPHDAVAVAVKGIDKGYQP